MSIDQQIARLEYLAEMIAKYSAAWYCAGWNGPSKRQRAWQEEYDAAAYDTPEAWKAYCAKHGWLPDEHDASEQRSMGGVR
jgi:hypothetical protein